MAANTVPRLKDLLTFGPNNDAQWVALRAVVTDAVPLLVLYVTGHLELAGYAVLVGFTAVFGRHFAHASRLRVQAIAGSSLVLSVALGSLVALSPHRYALVVPVAAAWVFLASLLVDRVRWTPPGPLFQIFGLGATAAVATTPSQIGWGMLVAVGTLLWALMIGYAGRIIQRITRGRTAREYVDPATLPGPMLPMLPNALQYAIGSLVAGAIPMLAGIGHPYWSMVSYISVMLGMGPFHQLLRGLHRIIGTVIGVLIGGAVLLSNPDHLVIVIIVIIAAGLIELFVQRNYTLALLFMSPMVLLMGEMGQHVPVGPLMLQRIFETLVGAVLAILVALVAGRKRNSP